MKKGQLEKCIDVAEKLMNKPLEDILRLAMQCTTKDQFDVVMLAFKSRSEFMADRTIQAWEARQK